MSKELKRHSVRGVKYNGEEICGGFAYYDADEVDALLAEKDKEIARLEAMRKVHVEAIASMEDRLHQDEKKIRKLRRALWLARAERAIAEAEYWYGHTSGMYYIDATDVPDEEYDPYKRVKDSTIGWYKTWMNVERKCRAKAEEYR